MKFRAKFSREISGSDFVRNRLITARELYSLKIRAGSDFPLTADCLRALVESRLRKLHLSSFKFVLNDLQLFELIYLKNRVLPNRTLKRLKFPNMDESCFILFATFFRSLEKLVVGTLSENILTNVFQY